MSERAQLDHALIDVDMLHKPKTLAMMQRFGKVSYGAFVELIAQLSRATGAVIERDTALAVADFFGINGSEWLEFLLKREMIEEKDGFITQSRVAADQEKLHANRQKWNEKNKKKSNPRVNSGVTPELIGSVPGGVPPIPVNTEQLNTEDLKDLDLDPKNTVRPPKIKPVVMLVPWFDCPLVTLDPIEAENFKMRLSSEGLCPEFDKPDAMTCAATVQRHREKNPGDTRIYSALTTFGIKEAHAKNQKKPRDGPKRAAKLTLMETVEAMKDM